VCFWSVSTSENGHRQYPPSLVPVHSYLRCQQPLGSLREIHRQNHQSSRTPRHRVPNPTPFRIRETLPRLILRLLPTMGATVQILSTSSGPTQRNHPATIWHHVGMDRLYRRHNTWRLESYTHRIHPIQENVRYSTARHPHRVEQRPRVHLPARVQCRCPHRLLPFFGWTMPHEGFA